MCRASRTAAGTRALSQSRRRSARRCFLENLTYRSQRPRDSLIAIFRALYFRMFSLVYLAMFSSDVISSHARVLLPATLLSQQQSVGHRWDLSVADQDVCGRGGKLPPSLCEILPRCGEITCACFLHARYTQHTGARIDGDEHTP
ncbi:unnamed protein product [Ectocarpus sp. 4 AP-2014]